MPQIVYFYDSYLVSILGEHNRKKDEKTEQYMSIAEIHFPKQFNPLANTFDADIAVFKFRKPAIFTDYVIPVCFILLLPTLRFQTVDTLAG